MSGRSQYYRQYYEQSIARSGDDYAERSSARRLEEYRQREFVEPEVHPDSEPFEPEGSFSAIIGALQKQPQQRPGKNGLVKLGR